MNNIEKLALAGLLHDIGKFYLRTTPKEDISNYNKEDFKYEHALYSYIAIKKFFREYLEKNLNLNPEEIANIASKHHNPSNELEKIMQIADWFSSAERERIKEDEINFLHTVFERVSFTGESDTGEKDFGYYNLEPLALDKRIFPKTYEGIYEGNFIKFTGKNRAEIEEELGNYKDLWNRFVDELKKLSRFKGKQAFIFIYYLLQKYIWCVPASTYDIEKKSRHYPDISLFDHSRILSAIACAIYDYAKQTGLDISFKELEKQNFLLLIEADINGIQKFIYNLGKTQKIENFSISKALRGRSFLVSMIPEIISRYILSELGYTITNAIYTSGGKFQLLVANTENNKKKLEEIEEKLQEYFYKEFFAELGITIAYKEFSGEYLTGKDNKNYADVIDELQILLDKKKKQRFDKQIGKDENESKKEFICPSCKKLPVEKEDAICYLCEKSNEIGNKLPKIKYIVFGKNITNQNNITSITLGDFGTVYLVEEENIYKFKDAEEILLLNDTTFEKNNGFKFLGNTVPFIDENNKEFFKTIAENKDDETFKIGVVPFDLLAELSEGDKKLGIFRADVDNLGLIFSDGLRKKGENDSERYTISRVATLSRMLDLFFSGYINKLVQDFTKESLPIKKKLGNKEIELKNINSLIYIVYSGGDDLFLIAPYNIILDFALRLREEFYEYTGKNLDFGLSGGIYISSPTTPIHMTAKFSENLENIAKKTMFKQNGDIILKDNIAILDKPFRWRDYQGRKTLEILIQNEYSNDNSILYNIGISNPEENKEVVFYEYIIKLANKIIEYYEKDKISRSFLFKLLRFHQSYIGKEEKIKAMIYPKIYYQIARNIKDNDVREFFENTLIKEGFKENGKILITTKNVLKNLDVIIPLVLMKTRGGN